MTFGTSQPRRRLRSVWRCSDILLLPDSSCDNCRSRRGQIHSIRAQSRVPRDCKLFRAGRHFVWSFAMVKSSVIFGLAVLLVSGCLSKIEHQTKKPPNSIIGKTTQDIGKHDPEAKQEVSDQKIHASDPITAPLIAY